MSIDQLDKIDFISTAPDGKVVLTISDHLIWDQENTHLFQLQSKINSYLHFIESGQIFDSYPASKGKVKLIKIHMKYTPTNDALIFLNKCKETILNMGIEFDWQTI